MIAILAAVFLVITSTAHGGDVKCGIDNLVDTDFELLRYKRVVLVSHAAARARTGNSTAEEFLGRTDVTTVRILAPEHGFYGVVQAGKSVSDNMVLGTPTLSLYGPLRRPTPNMIEDADAVVVDFQDIGSRSYTYVSTMMEVMEACAKYGIPMVVLDRPNPLGGLIVDGNLPDANIKSFVARIPTPYVHGMTLGEIATMANGEGWLEKDEKGQPRQCDLLVVKCKRWKRSMSWEETGLDWYPTSPNIPSIEAARGYAVTGLSGELGLASIGVGTTAPFTMIGSPNFQRDSILENRFRSYGVTPRWGNFRPIAGKHASTINSGYHLAFARDTTFKPFHAAIGMIVALRDQNRARLTDELRNSNRGNMFVKTSGTKRIIDLLYAGSSWSELRQICDESVNEFRRARDAYLLYER